MRLAGCALFLAPFVAAACSSTRPCDAPERLDADAATAGETSEVGGCVLTDGQRATLERIESFAPERVRRVSGTIRADVFELAPDELLVLEGDTTILAKAGIAIRGDVVADPLAGGHDGASFELRCPRPILVLGDVRAGDGRAGRALGEAGGRGGSIRFVAAVVSNGGDHRAGDGGRGGPAGGGGDGGEVLSSRLSGGPGAAGGSYRGGDGGPGTVAPPGFDGPPASGGAGGGVFFIEPDEQTRVAWGLDDFEDTDWVALVRASPIDFGIELP